MISGSLFIGVEDVRPWGIPSISFGELVGAMIAEAIECDPSTKLLQCCITPATYGRGETRSSARAISWDWFAGDIDNKGGTCVGASMDETITVMRGLGTPWFAYTTSSSQPDAECYRIMFPLDRAVSNAEFGDVWQAFARLLPLDPATKDVSRIFIVPRTWAGRANRMEHDLSGSPVCVDEILRRFPAPVPISPPVLRGPAFTSPPRRTTPDDSWPSLGAPYVPENAIFDALLAPSGGRMYRFLLTVAFSALRKGYDISPADLQVIGRELAAQLGRGTSDIWRDAESAHRYAENHYVDERDQRFGRLQAACLPKGLR